MAGETAVRLLVGLGNPGPEYQLTRHNAGFWWIDQLAAQQRVTLRPESRFNGEFAQCHIAGQTLLLLKPMTYMNRSGLAIVRAAQFYKIPPSAILVIHDELDLAPGVARLKRGGGHGGHNGLRDTQQQLGSADYLRLRLGIGHPGHKDQVVGFVLHKPSQPERALIEDAIDDSLRVLPLLLEGQEARAMNTLHSRPAPGATRS